MSSVAGGDSPIPSEGPQGWTRPSIYDVADRAGVSHMTVSRVLNDHPNIKAATRERVLRAIDDMNYTRNSIARALATRRTMRIGVLVDAPVEYGPSSTLRAIERAARDQGYTVSSFSTADGAGLGVDSGIDALITHGIDGLCVISPRYSSMDVLRQQQTGLPTLVIKAEPDESLLTVGVDQELGAQIAVDHLIALGHRRILHVAGPLDWIDARARERTWHRIVEEAGLPVIPAIIGDWTSDFGFQVGLHAPQIDQVTAVFAANDQIALGVIHGLSKRGLSVPEDISVVGFDDLPDARHFLPPLTTIRQDFEALGAVSISLLLRAIEGDTTVARERIAPTLVLRESTRPIRDVGIRPVG
jgi:DNA-binding LacI/PurR family transcriptional regulator